MTSLNQDLGELHHLIVTKEHAMHTLVVKCKLRDAGKKK